LHLSNKLLHIKQSFRTKKH